VGGTSEPAGDVPSDATTDEFVRITWWLWEHEQDGRGYEIVVKVRTFERGSTRIDSPSEFFVHYEALSFGFDDAMLLDAEAFARLRTEGRISCICEGASPPAP
jgi:hypothetical protein